LEQNTQVQTASMKVSQHGLDCISISLRHKHGTKPPEYPRDVLFPKKKQSLFHPCNRRNPNDDSNMSLSTQHIAAASYPKGNAA